MDPSAGVTNPRKRARTATDNIVNAPVAENSFIADQDANDSADDEDDDDGKPKDKKAGRRKIKIEFIQDKSRRHITFSKRKAGIMKKAYELSTLTGTQVLLLVVSETGLVYTFTTAKLQPLVTQPEGKNLIQACLNAPHGQLPSSMPVGTPIGRPAPQAPVPNVPGGLSISGGPEDANGDDGGAGEDDGERAEKRRRRSNSQARTSPPTPAQLPSQPPVVAAPQAPQGGPPGPPMSMGGSPHPPPPQQQQQQQGVPGQPQGVQYGYPQHPQQQQPQQQQHDPSMYQPHMVQSGYYQNAPWPQQQQQMRQQPAYQR